MELKSEIISISKIRDGLFIADNRAGTNLDLLMQYKISHIINATGIPLPYSFESLGIKYLTINWTENPPENTVIINDDLILNIIKFIDESNDNGEGLLGFSVTGKNRICVVIILYLMSKYNWSLKNCLEYIRKRKHDVDINNFYMNQLELYEKELITKNNFFNSPSNWNSDKIKDKDELVMRNTYMNEVNKNKNVKENKSDNNNQYKIVRKVEWGDNKKYARQMAQPGLIHFNVDKDLFLKTNIEDITEHLHMKPLRSCIKNYVYANTASNINSIKNKALSTNRRKKTKIYLAANVQTVNNSNKDCGIDLNNLNSIKEEKQNGFFLTQGRSKDTEIEKERERERENKVIDGDKMNIFEDITLTDKNDDIINNLIQMKGNKDKDIREKTEKTKNKMYAKDKIIIDSNKRESNNNERSKPKENTSIDEKHIINNLNIFKNMDNSDSEDEVKLNIIKMNKKNEKEKDQKKSESEDKKELKKTMKEYGFNIVNVEKKNKDSTITNFNTDIKPILENLLKIDPNLETLNKYLKSKKKNTYLNFSETFSKNNLDKVKKNKTNTNPKNDTISVNNNLNSKNYNDKGNSNNVNLVPINLNKTSKDKKTKSKTKDDKSNNNNKLYLFNLNLNIENSNTININNNIINNNNKNNKGFNRKLNNFFTDEYGNYFQGFNNKKKRNTYSARTGYQKNFNNYNNQQFLSPNVNYYLANVPHSNKNKEKKGNTIIPNINYNYNNNNSHINRINHSTHSQKSSKNKNNKDMKKNSQTKIFMRPAININKNNINNAINANKNFLITSITNSNNINDLNRKESKYNTI